MAELLLTPPGAIDPADRELLREAGVVVVETDDPTACRFLRASEVVSSSDMLWAAMDALRQNYNYDNGAGDKHRERLASNLIRLVLDQHSEQGGE